MKKFHIYTNETKDAQGITTKYIADYLIGKGCTVSEKVDNTDTISNFK